MIYKAIEFGLSKADLFVNDFVIIELEVAKSYLAEDEPQILNELKVRGVKVGLPINYGRVMVEFKQMVL